MKTIYSSSPRNKEKLYDIYTRGVGGGELDLPSYSFDLKKKKERKKKNDIHYSTEFGDF